MAKAPVIKFPRIQAGYYGITRDGEFVGYIMKEVNDDSKETNWWVINDSVPEKEPFMVNTADAIDSPDSLLREAKETAKGFFLNEQPQAISPISPLKEVEWNETEEEEEVPEPETEVEVPVTVLMPELDEDDLLQDDSDFVLDDSNEFDLNDELDLEDEFEYVTSDEPELSLV